MKKTKYPKIDPQFFVDKNNNPTSVYLDYGAYESIFEEMKDIKKKINELKKKKSKKK